MSKSVIAVLGCTLAALIAAVLWVPVERALDTTVIGPVFLPVQVEDQRYVWIGQVGSRSTINGWEHPGAWAGSFEVYWRVRWVRLAQTLTMIVLLGGAGLLILRVRSRGWNRRVVVSALVCGLAALVALPMLYVPTRSDLRTLGRVPLGDGSGRYRVRLGPWEREAVATEWLWVWKIREATKAFDSKAVFDRQDDFIVYTYPNGRAEKQVVYNAGHVEWPIVIVEQALVLLLGGGLLTFLIRRDRRRRAEAAG